jgi:cytoskeletal protein CcmA (bactofilin family)
MIMFERWKRSKRARLEAAEFAPLGRRTFIGEQVHMDGFIRCREDLHIDGSFEGTIELKEHRLSVGEKGRVAAEIRVRNATISGQVKGNILSEGKIEITRHGRFVGKIEAEGITVADGAYLKAVIQMARGPACGPSEECPASGQIDSREAFDQENETLRYSK